MFAKFFLIPSRGSFFFLCSLGRGIDRFYVYFVSVSLNSKPGMRNFQLTQTNS